jgi:tetratricopeptide (TPR) repeat protein
MSWKHLEIILRAKQSLKDFNWRQKKFSILPQTNLRIGDTVIPLSPISSMTIKGWRNLIALYEKSDVDQRNEFKRKVKSLLISDNLSATMLETKYVSNIFSLHRAMYLEFLGTAYYARGDVKKALKVFEELYKERPTDRVCLYMSRCLMQIGTTREVLELLKRGCEEYPDSAILLLSLANVYYRTDSTKLANETIERLNKKDLIEIQRNAHNINNLKTEI